jgi:calmodulin
MDTRNTEKNQVFHLFPSLFLYSIRREVFDLFDREKSDSVMNEEVGTIMRALGAFPSEKTLVKEILPEMQDDEPSGFVSYSKLERVLLRILSIKECEPDSGDILLQAFRTIDTGNTGFIPADVMEDLLTAKGTPFRSKELDTFFQVAKDSETGNVYYEDYIALMSKKA